MFLSGCAISKDNSSILPRKVAYPPLCCHSEITEAEYVIKGEGGGTYFSSRLCLMSVNSSDQLLVAHQKRSGHVVSADEEGKLRMLNLHWTIGSSHD